MEDKKEFTEVQKVRQWWLWAILLLTALPLVVIILLQFFTGKPFGNNPASNTDLLLMLIFIILPILLFFYLFKLSVRMDKDVIAYGFFSQNELKWADVKEASVIKYNYFGFGYKISSKYGEIYNVSGDKGLWLTTKSGGKILIGTHKPNELTAFLKEIGKQ